MRDDLGHVLFPFERFAALVAASTSDVMTLANVGRSMKFARVVAASAVALSFFCFFPGQPWSQMTKTIRVVVPFPPGGAMDFLARVLAEEVGKAHGPKILIENRPGAGTVIATEAVSRAAPDGTTVLMIASSFVINPHLRHQNYDPLTSFDAICNLVRSPLVFVVNSASPYRTFGEFVEAVRAKPGELTIGTVGPATSFHIAVATFKRTTNLNFTYVPFPGGAPALTSLMGGHVTSVFANYVEVIEHVKAGKLRALATGSEKRIELLPDVPTLAEAGYTSLAAENWFAVVTPAKSPQAIISELIGMYTAALQRPEATAKLAVQGLFPLAMCGADFAAHLRNEFDRYGRAIRETNIMGE
jgi:tripartite-type tricarboxylate transporter receptor subunit TctC